MTQIPVPTPNAGETQNDFVSRCISSLHSTDPERSDDQITAMCFSQWRNREGAGTIHPHFRTILQLFTKRDGKEAGLKRFWDFVYSNALSIFKPYDPAIQFTEGIQLREAFDWLRPHIEFFRKDKEAKYYKIKCIHAITSMNERNYEDTEQMKFAGPTMNFRPVNINHNHSRWLPYPRTRLDYSKTEDNTVEGILRVDNQDKYFQQQLDHDPAIPEKEWINHPSIEGRPNLGGMKEDGYHFTAISFLEKGYQLPGDPLSEIAPLFIEAVSSGETCLIIDGEQLCLPCTEDQGGISMTENVEVSEAEGNINPEGALCPQCGHKITPDPTIEAGAINCPRCDTVMVRLPAKSVEAIKDLSDEESLQYARDNLAELSELFRPPFPFTPNAKFNKITGADLKTTNLPSIDGPIDGATIGIVEFTKLKADFEEFKLQSIKEQEIKDAEIKLLRNDKANLSEQLAEQTRINAASDALKAEISKRISESADLKAEITTLKSSLTESANTITSRDAKIETLNTEIEKLNESVAKLKARMETYVKDLHEALEKSSTNTQKAINETQERARIQEENAGLREDVAKLTRKISDLTEKMANEAKTLLENEQLITSLREQLHAKDINSDANLAELTEIINQAKKFHKWAWDKLKEAGYAVTEK